MKHITVNLSKALVYLTSLLLAGYARADTPGAAHLSPAWPNPVYGAWHSYVIGGGGYLLNAVLCPSDPRRLYVYGDMDGLFRSH